MKPTEWAYLAGLIDGEGTISIVRWHVEGRPRTELRVTVYNNNLAMMAWITEKFGGYKHKVRSRKRKANWAPSYAWDTHSKAASELLRGVLPYLVAKRGQAELALQYQTTKRRCGRKGTAQTVLDWREQLRAKVKLLNRRGVDAVGPERREEAHEKSGFAQIA